MSALKVSIRDRGALTDKLDQRVAAFTQQVNAARRSSAAKATQVSRSKVVRKRPGQSTPRANRYGGLRDAIRWRPVGQDGSGVGVAIGELNAKFPPWLVQEIGTNQRAIQREGGKPNPSGRPTKGARYVKTVRSQVGRRISPGLVWARNGKFQSPRKGFGTDQLVARSKAAGAPPRFNRAQMLSQPGIRISKEIDGQHFLRDGGQAGFREYRESVLTAARSQLKKKRT